jgi:ankyrin repeat protein
MRKYMILFMTVLMVGAMGVATPVLAQSSIGPGNTELVTAVRSGDLDQVRRLLDAGEDPNEVGGDTTSALAWAAFGDDIGATMLLLDAGADPNLVNRFNVGPLHEAIILGNPEMVEVLVNAGADVNAPAYESGETPLMAAARVGNTEVVQMLLDAGTEVRPIENAWGQSALMFAASQGHAPVVKMLIESGADIDQVTSYFEHPDVGRALAGMGRNDRTAGSFTALHFAARSGHAEAGAELIAAGADMTIEEEAYGYTPLQTAVANQQADFVASMIESGANLDDGSLYLAVDAINYAQRLGATTDKGNALITLERLLDAGADPNQIYTKRIARHRGYGSRIAGGATPLYLASTIASPEAVSLLVEAGAYASVQNELGVTPLLATLGGGTPGPGGRRRPLRNLPARFEMAKALLAAGARVDTAERGSGNTPLHLAASNGAQSIYDALVAFGASMTVENDEGQTPADLLER